MKTSYALLTMIVVALLLGACTTPGQSTTRVASNFIQQQNVVATTKETYPAKNPQRVAFFTNEQKPMTPYRVIGVATVSKFNLIGVQRKDETLQEMMKKLAASIGGDALINIDNNNSQLIQANVIQFQKILL